MTNNDEKIESKASRAQSRRIAKNLVEIILFPITLLMGLSKAFLAGLTVLFLVLSLTLPILTTLSVGVYALVSGIATTVTGGTHLLAKQSNELQAERKATAKAMEQEKLARARATSLASENAKLKANARTVTFRGVKRPINEVVAEVSESISVRTLNMVKYDLGGMVGQAIPYVGVAAIVGVTAYDLTISCEIMKELHDLDVVFNPDHAIDANEVCGMRVPTPDELWEDVKVATANTASDLGDKASEILDYIWE